MEKITKEYAESLADKLLEKINNVSNNSDVNITIENVSSITKDSLVKTILANDNIYIPFKRSIQFDNLQDETVKNICKPTGSITMTETFNKGFSVEELLNTDLSSLDVHCEGVNSQGYVSYGVPYTSNSDIPVSNSSKYYAVTYTGTSTDGTDFCANAIYNTKDASKKEYYISKQTLNASPRSTTKQSNIVTSTGSNINSSGFNTSKTIKIGEEKYQWNHYEGTIQNSNNTTSYSWEDSIQENSGRIITNATCTYNNSAYIGIPVQFSVNDFSTGSTYKEENGVIKSATGSLSIICKYNKNGTVSLEKPTFEKSESASIVSTNLSKIDKKCIGLVSVNTNSITNSQEVVITPNFVNLKNAADVSKIVDALKKWNIGSNSNATSFQGNNIWINTANGSNSFAQDGTYNMNSYVALSDFFKKI